LWIRVALKYPVAFLNKPLAYYDQDVSVTDKAVVKDRIYTPETIYIFNLDYLEEEEHSNRDLKQLLDLLRVYTLERYRLQGAYPDLVQKEIAKVDFSRQKKWYWFLYHLPVQVVKFLYAVMKILIRILK